MKLIDVTKAFQSDEQCSAYLEKNALANDHANVFQ